MLLGDRFFPIVWEKIGNLGAFFFFKSNPIWKDLLIVVAKGSRRSCFHL